MKRLFALSFLLSATSTLLAANPSFAQTVPIISGTLNTVNANPGYITSLTSSTFLTSIGTVTINSDGFNGTLTNTISNDNNDSSGLVTSSALGTTNPPNNSGAGMFVLWQDNRNFFVFTGTTNGTSPNGAFTNASTTINADYPTAGNRLPAYTFRITGGSITLPAPPPPVVVVPPVVVPPVVTCTDCLNVIPDLRISNSTFLSPASQQPEYSQEYSRNNFSTSSFDGGRVLGLENK